MMTDPIEILEWIRAHWTNLKQTNRLEKAIKHYLEVSKDDGTLSVQDVIDIEESANEGGKYLK